MDAKLIRIQGSIDVRKLLAEYWIAMATTGMATKRTMAKMDRQLTDEEKTQDALEIAQRHIHAIQDLIDNI